MNILVCQVCGHIEFEKSPDKCPVCFAVKNKFEINNNVFIDVEKKHKEISEKHVPIIRSSKNSHPPLMRKIDSIIAAIIVPKPNSST